MPSDDLLTVLEKDLAELPPTSSLRARVDSLITDYRGLQSSVIQQAEMDCKREQRRIFGLLDLRGKLIRGLAEEPADQHKHLEARLENVERLLDQKRAEVGYAS